MFSKAANWTETLFRTAAAEVSQASRLARPNVKAAFLAAGVAAPILLSNKDRNPGETALITTPTVAAAFVAAPAAGEVFKRAKQTAGVMFRSYSDFERVLRNNDIYALDKILAQLPAEHREVFRPLRTATKIGFYGEKIATPEQRAARLAEKTEKATKSVREHIAKLRESFAVDDPRWKSVAVSVREATIGAQPMDEALVEKLGNTVLQEGADAKSWVDQMLNRFLPEGGGEVNGRFARSLDSRIRQDRRARDSAGKLIGKHDYVPLEKPAGVPEVWGWNQTGDVGDAAKIIREYDGGQRARLADLLEKRWGAMKDMGYQNVRLHYDQKSMQPIGLELMHENEKRNMRFGIKDLKSGEVYTGSDFSVSGVGTRLVQIDQAGAPVHYEADEFALQFLGDSRIEHDALKTQVRSAQNWTRRFGQSAEDAKAAKYGARETLLFSRSGVLADAKIHYDGKAPGDFSYEQNVETLKARVAAGERYTGGTGGASKGRMYLDAEHLDATFRFDKPTSMDVTQMKRWHIAEELPAHLQPRVLTTDMAKMIVNTDSMNLLNLTVGHQSAASFEYFGMMASIADRGKILKSEKKLRKMNKQKIADVLSGKTFTTEAEQVWYEQTRSRMQQLYQNAVRQGQHANVTEEVFFNKMVGSASKNGRLLRDFSSLGTAGGEGHFLVFNDRVNVPVFGHQTHELAELSEGLQKHVATENGKLKPNWKDFKLKGGFQIGVKNDLSLNPAFLGNSDEYIVTGIRTAGEGKKRRYVVDTAEVENIAKRGMKTAFGNKKMVAVDADSQAVMPILREFNAAVGNQETALLDGVDALVSSHEMNKLAVDLEEMVGLSQRLITESGRVKSEPIQAARAELQQALANEFAVQSGDFVDLIDVDKLRARAEKITGKTGLEAYMEYQNSALKPGERSYQTLRERLFGTESRMDYSKLADLAKLKSEELVSRYGILGKLELSMVNEAMSSDVVRQSSPLLHEFLSRPAYQNRPKKYGNRFVDFISENFMRFRAGAMEYELEKRQRSVFPTEDALRLLEENGMHGHIKDIIGELKPIGSGDPRQTTKAIEWFKGAADQVPDGAKVVSLGEDLKERAGTILDWRRPDLKDNFFYKLSSPTKVKYGEETSRTYSHIAHPGYAGFGGAPNQYNSGLSAKPSELGQAFEKIVRADSEFVRSQDPTELASAIQEYESTLNSTIPGKGNLLRARMYHPQAFGGTPAKVVTGESEMFDLFLSREHWNDRLRKLPTGVKQMAEQYGYFYASHGRHPQNYMGYVKIRAREGLTNYQVGMGDEYRELIRGDFDLDPSEIIPVTSEATWKEAHEVLTDQHSRQWILARERNLYRLHEQNAQITQDVLDNGARSVAQRSLKNYGYAEQMQAAEARIAGKYIGHYSHLNTRTQLAMEGIPGHTVTKEFLSEARAQIAAEEGFWNLRQMAIALQKHKSGGELGDPLQYVRRFNEAFSARNKTGGENLLSLVQEAAKHNADEQTTLWTEQHQKTFGDLIHRTEHRPFQVGEEVNLLEEVLHQDQGTRKKIVDLVAQGADPTTFRGRENAFDLLVRDAQDTEDFIKSFMKRNPGATSAEARNAASQNLYKTLSKLDSAAPELATHLAKSGFAADHSAGRLRTIIDGIKKAGREGKAAMGSGGKVALSGGLVAAGAGAFLMGDPGAMEGARAPRPTSRPEEQIGVTDQVPGAPETGMQSGNPQRNVTFQQGPQRAIVAPIRRGTNLDVTMNAPDESPFQQLRHRLQSVGSGDAFITNNHIGGWRDGATRLSTRERLREDLNRY
jgi:hypothetical protein